MSDSGYINWHRLSARGTLTGHTYVYAYWLVDYQRSHSDRGVTLLKAEHAHPDWFLHAERADESLAAYCSPDVIVSGNFTDVFDEGLYARPLLASVLLGTSNRRVQGWHCELADLDRRGRRLVKSLSELYLRPAHIITFVDLRPMNDAVPEAGSDQATVVTASGTSL